MDDNEGINLKDPSYQRHFLHSTTSAVKETKRWIELITGDKFKHPDDLIKSLQDGVLLCRLVNDLKPGCIRRINYMQTPVAFLDNLSVFQYSCKNEFGFQESQLFDIRDLDDLDIRGTLESEDQVEKETYKRLRNILVTMFWLGKASRSIRPDTVLDLRPFQCLVDPACFVIATSASSSSGEPLAALVTTTNNTTWKYENLSPGGGRRDDKKIETDLQMKLSEWKGMKTDRVTLCDRTPAEDVCGSDVSQNFKESHPIEIPYESGASAITRDQFQHKNDDDEFPATPNWTTFPGEIFNMDDVKYFDEDFDRHGNASYPGTSSSSSASSFATKEFADSSRDFLVSGKVESENMKEDETRGRTDHLSTTYALLGRSPETLTSDEASNFDNLMRDVEKFSNISKSQSLHSLEDFESIGFDGDEGGSLHGEPKVMIETDSCDREISSFKNGIRDDEVDESGRVDKIEKGKQEAESDYLDELIKLEKATRKYDNEDTLGIRKEHSRVTSESTRDFLDNHLLALRSPRIYHKPNEDPTKLSELVGITETTRANFEPTQKFNSTILDRFNHDLDSILKCQPQVKVTRSFDLEIERRRMEEWNKKVEEKLKDKFEKAQDVLKQRLREDLIRAHQAERLKQLQEEKFLEEEEVIEVKNRRGLRDGARSKFSKSSLSLFAPLPFNAESKYVSDQSKSSELPMTFGSLTNDWLSKSFSQNNEKSLVTESFCRVEHSDSCMSMSEKDEKNKSDDLFEEPRWMNLVSDKVDKDFVDIPIAKATVELLPDSLTASNESLPSNQSHSPLHSREDVMRDNLREKVEERIHDKNELKVSSNERSGGAIETPPIPERGDSLLVSCDILTSRHQATYLTFDASIESFNKSQQTLQSSPLSPQLPSSPWSGFNTNIPSAPISSVIGGNLLTPSSDRSSETYKYVPPSPITPRQKKLDYSISSSPRTSLARRPDYLLIQDNKLDEMLVSPSKPVDFLFSYHDDQLKRRYYWTMSPVSTNQIEPKELPSDPRIGSPANRVEEKASCSGCGYCLDPSRSINIFEFKCQYHPECFRCRSCETYLSSDDAAMYESSPRCLRCFVKLSRH